MSFQAERKIHLFRVEGLWLSLWALTAYPLAAQVSVDGHDLQIHGFVSQGFAYSNDNNYLTMDTSQGSFVFTDAGLNVSTQLTDKFRVGAQAYLRNVGELGHGHLTLDWASGDYRFSDWLGVRAGKVKTVFGLYNDIQDADFTYTWALLPQSIYPLDLRETTIAHVGADLYGTIPLHQFGSLAYTGYAGKLSEDRSGGYVYGLEGVGLNDPHITGSAEGADLKWTTPLSGLLLGASYLNTPQLASGYDLQFGTPDTVKAFVDHRTIFSGRYTFGNLMVEGEYSVDGRKANVLGATGPYGPPVLRLEFDERAWYAGVTYQVSKHLALGTYNSRFFPNAGRDTGVDSEYAPPAARHIFDQVLTARLDFTKYLDFKIEGHFIDGYGDPSSFRGFYPQNNPNGFKPKTDLLILRMGFNF